MGRITPETITRLWDAKAAALVLYARQWCDTPEDVVQEAFLLLVRQAETPQNPAGWLYRVVRTRAINAARGASRRSRREAKAADRAPAWFETTEADRLDAVNAAEALRHLPLDQREAIVARLWGGLSFDEISQLTGSSLSSVYRSYQRGIASLRERLGESCPTSKKTMNR